VTLTDLFIPAAERYELMVAVDRWVVHNALLGDWHELAISEGIRLSVNLSAQSINDETFLGFVLDVIDRSRLPPDRINFEITETAVMTHLGNARVVVDELRQRGCTVALDDFGSGLSSFSYLRHFNVDFVKIDGGFVRAMVSSEPDRIIVESINDLAHRLGAQTIAEFVTDEPVLDSVRAIRVDYAQGYAIGRPEPVTSYYGIWPAGDSEP
jgi:EAL domain-containing protein (putative c-di-GMP-specific phosphodiesterase class I)